MKHLIYSIIFATAVALMSGCSLKETPKSSFSESEAYSSPTLVYVNTVASLYNKLHDRFHGADDNYSYMSEFTADILLLPGRQSDWVDGGKHQNAFLHKWDPSTDYLKSLWNNSYSDITLCNAALAQLVIIRDSLKTLLPEEVNPYIAEVRGIRAFYYMWLVDFFGRIPIVTSPKTGIGDVKQSERKDAYEFVKTELCEIVDSLADEMSQLKGNYYSRITRPVVYAMIARLAINGAVFTQNEWYNKQFTGGITKVEKEVTEAGKKDIWKIKGVERNAWETVIYCKDELEKRGYKLETDFSFNFKTGNESSYENIFIEPMDDDTYRISDTQVTRSLHYNHAVALGFTSWNGASATKHVLKVFGYKEEYATDPSDPTKAQPHALESGTYECDDPRFEQSFFYGPCCVGNDTVASGISEDNWPNGCYIGYAIRNNFSTEEFSDPWGKYIVKWGGVRLKKYEFDPTTSDKNYFNADRVIYRFGDMLLLAAEAEYRLENKVKATALVNRIRTRAGVAQLTANVGLQEIVDEKLREEIWETMGRRGDLVRFGLYTEESEDKYPGVPRTSSASDWTYDADGYTCVFPIPVDVINLNKNITQNKGY